MFHPGTEQTRLDEGELWLLVSVSCLGLGCFLLVFVLLVFFSPSSRRVSFPFNDDLGTPPTRRPHSWKKKIATSPSLSTVCRLGSAQTCRSRGTDEKALAGITPAFGGSTPPSGNLRALPLEFGPCDCLEALLDNQVETRVRSRVLDWIAQGLLSVRMQESELTPKGLQVTHLCSLFHQRKSSSMSHR